MNEFRHADFWIAIATIAPVIFLSNAVVVTQAIKASGAASWFAYAASASASVVSSMLIFAALGSLADRRDQTPISLVVVGVLVAVVGTFLAAVLTGLARDPS